MNDPDADESLAALLAALDKDAAPPDAAFLDRLREQSAAIFEAAGALSGGTGLQTGEAPTAEPRTENARIALTGLETDATNGTPSPRKRTMLSFSFRWLATGVAAVLVLGVGLAYWVGATNEFDPLLTRFDEKFVIENKLTDDGRIGKVTDAQGVVSVKPVLHERWSPVQPRLVLKPGDWLRTDSRGANAVALQLLKAAAVIVGPHSTVELVKADEIRLLAGEVEITATDAAPVELHGPDKQKLSVKGKQHFRVEKEKLVRVEKEPLWLQGFKGTTANESLGSLIATVDGRNVPLTVGYHHVTVDIRDQIARTTIEESFVNHTRRRARRRVPLPAAAGRVDLRLRHVDRQRTGRGRRGREAARPRDLRDDPAREARPRPARMDRRQHLQGPRVPDPGAVREADQDHLHAGAAAPGQPLPLQLRACRANCSSSTRCAT